MFLQFVFDMLGCNNAGRKMEPWMIEMLDNNAVGSQSNMVN